MTTQLIFTPPFLEFSHPIVELNLKDRQMVSSSDGFTTCFNYFSSGENRINIDFEGESSENRLQVGIVFYHCVNSCQFYIYTSGRSNLGKEKLFYIDNQSC